MLLAFVGVILATAAWGYSFTLQTRNGMEVNDCADHVRSLRDGAGSLPDSVECRDEWGRAILYLHTDDHFALVSFGSDGKADEANYTHLLTDSPPRRISSNCLLTCLDTVVVDSTPWLACGKGRRDIP